LHFQIRIRKTDFLKANENKNNIKDFKKNENFYFHDYIENNILNFIKNKETFNNLLIKNLYEVSIFNDKNQIDRFGFLKKSDIGVISVIAIPYNSQIRDNNIKIINHNDDNKKNNELKKEKIIFFLLGVIIFFVLLFIFLLYLYYRIKIENFKFTKEKKSENSIKNIFLKFKAFLNNQNKKNKPENNNNHNLNNFNNNSNKVIGDKNNLNIAQKAEYEFELSKKNLLSKNNDNNNDDDEEDIEKF
jgi:hypothetical protein